MKCQNCGAHEATIKYMQMINGEKDEMLLCEKCAKDMKIDMNFDMHFGFDNVFASLFGAEPMVKPVELSDEFLNEKDVSITDIVDSSSRSVMVPESSEVISIDDWLLIIPLFVVLHPPAKNIKGAETDATVNSLI